MKVLVLQLKRIGDLILTTPALKALARTGAAITLVVDAPCASLLPAISDVAECLIYSKKGDNQALWRRLRKGAWDVCIDFTGTDRSALMAWLSRTPRRVTFQWVRKRLLRRLAYHEFVDSPVRLAHTCDHYCDLVRGMGNDFPAEPSLDLPRETRENALELLAATGITGSYVLIHPGTARPEKYWLPERWAEIAKWLRELGHAVVITSGPDAFEQQHAASIVKLAALDNLPIIHPRDLLTFAAIVEKSRLVLSCDTAVVHFAAAFRQPQVALYGPTNPFHWRPRHERAIVLSATQPDAPMGRFSPKMKGASMAQVPVSTVQRAAEILLAAPR
jgi:ADP-heptose:LPS heptosyltransferase